MEKQKNIPQLRFPEYEGEWKEKRLEELFCEFKSGFGITSKKISESGRYPVYGGNGLRGFTDSFTHDGFYLLIGRQGALCGNVNRSYGKAYISEHAVACRANESSDTEWLAQRLNYYNLNRLSESSAQPGLSVNKLLRFKLIVPTCPEQQKNASFFTAIDQKITQLKRKLTLLEQYKKGVMQLIFSQEIRFKDDNGQEFPKWEKKKLKDVAEIKYGKDQKGIACENGQYPIFGTGGVMGRTNEFLSDKPSVLIGRKGTIDKPLFIDTPFWTVDTLFYTNLLSNVNAKWLYYNLTKVNWYKYNEASGVPSLSTSTINKIPIDLPSLGEQTRIANFLSAIDDKINHTEKQIEKAEVWKKGLMQQMFV